MKQIRNLENVAYMGLEQKKLLEAIEKNPALAALLYQLLIRLLTFLTTWFLDDQGNRLPFFKALGLFFKGEFWDAVRKLQAETAQVADQLK